MKKLSGEFQLAKFSTGLIILVSVSLVLVACSDNSTPNPTQASTTTANTTTTTTATANTNTTTTLPTNTAGTNTTTTNSTTANTITANSTTANSTPTVTPSGATTESTTAPTNSANSTAPAWFKDVPKYANAQPLALDAATLTALNINPSQFYAEAYSTSDNVTDVVSFYSNNLSAANWQLARKTPLSGDASAGAQLTFTRTENGASEAFVVLVGTAATLKAIPQTATFGAKVPDNQTAILLLAQTETAANPTPVAPSTTNLPAGVAAQNLSFDFGDGWVAQGQITYPAGKTGPFPTVILVSGSGNNDMDETLPESVAGVPGGSKIFRDIAYYLPTRGFAVVRYNKRGVIGIGPQVSPDIAKYLDVAKADTQYTQDAAFVLQQTQKNSLVDPKRVIMLGHSEGTLDVSHVATDPATAKDVAGVVLMGVQGYDLKTVLQYQLVDRDITFLKQDADTNKDGKISIEEFLNWANNLSATYKTSYINGYLAVDSSSPTKYKFKAALDKNGDGLLDLENELRPALQTQLANFPNVPALGGAANAPAIANWESNGSVTTVLPAYKGPVLMLNGEADTQAVVQGARDADAALAKAGNPDHTLITYPGLGHTFYPAKGIDQPLGPPQPKVLQDMGDWLSKHYNH